MVNNNLLFQSPTNTAELVDVGVQTTTAEDEETDDCDIK